MKHRFRVQYPTYLALYRQAILGGEESKHVELLSIKWLLLYKELQGAFGFSTPAFYDDGQSKSPSQAALPLLDCTPLKSRNGHREADGSGARADITTKGQYGAVEYASRDLASADSNLRLITLAGSRAVRFSEFGEEGEKRDREMLVKEEKGKEDVVGEIGIKNVLDAKGAGVQPDFDKARLFQEMCDIKRERDKEIEKMKAREKEWEHDKVRLEEEIRILRREAEREKQEERLQNEIDELKAKLSGTEGGDGQTRPTSGRKCLKEEGEGEEIETLLEENMVRR